MTRRQGMVAQRFVRVLSSLIPIRSPSIQREWTEKKGFIRSHTTHSEQ